MRWKYFLSTTGLLILCGCAPGENESATAVNQMVYVDLQTRDAVVSEQTDVIPAVHPVTGERSLMPGLYCDECEQWHPAPPIDELQRNPDARQCPRCRIAMSADGPWPDAVEP